MPPAESATRGTTAAETGAVLSVRVDPALAAAPPSRLVPGEDAKAAYLRGLSLIRSGNRQEALGLFEELAKGSPSDAAVQNALGVLYKKDGRLDLAIDAYRKAITARASFAEASYNLGIAYREKGDFQNAESAYLSAIKADGTLAGAHFNLAVLYDLYLNRPAEALRQYREYQGLGGSNELLATWIADLENRMRPKPQAPEASADPAVPPAV